MDRKLPTIFMTILVDAVRVARRAVRMEANRSGKQAENLRLGKDARMYTTTDRYDPKFVITKQPVKSFAFRKG